MHGRFGQMIIVMLSLAALLWPPPDVRGATSVEVGQSIADTIDATQANTTAVQAQAGQIEALQVDLAELIGQLDQLRQSLAALTARVTAIEADIPEVADPPTEPQDPVIEPEPAPVKTAVTGDWVLARLLAGQKQFNDLVVTGGVRLVWKTVNDVTFTRCEFRRDDAGFLLVVQARDDGTDASRSWTFNQCTFKNATASGAADDCSGLYLAGVDQFVFNGGAAVHNGWYGDGRWMRNHNVYLLKVGKVIFNDFLFKEGASQGLKAAGFEEVQVNRCTFDGNIVDLATDNRYHCGQLLVTDTIFRGTGGDGGILGIYAWSIDLNFSKNSGVLDLARFTRCTWIGPGITKTGNNYVLKAQGGNINKVELIDCDWSQWTDTPTVVNNVGDRLEVKKSAQ
ncbi:MAG: hypothetical protein IT445_03055 [Phycisphaeraceae bacterium]|nr:hypothetical protein [Phycisphaeraceae bacterium]